MACLGCLLLSVFCLSSTLVYGGVLSNWVEIGPFQGFSPTMFGTFPGFATINVDPPRHTPCYVFTQADTYWYATGGSSQLADPTQGVQKLSPTLTKPNTGTYYKSTYFASMQGSTYFSALDSGNERLYWVDSTCSPTSLNMLSDIGGTVNYGVWAIQAVQNKNLLFFSSSVGPATYVWTPNTLGAPPPTRITDIPLELTTCTDNYYVGQYQDNNVYVHDGTNLVVWSNPSDVSMFLATCFHVDDWLFCSGTASATGYEMYWLNLNNVTNYQWTLAETCPGTCAGDPQMNVVTSAFGRVWWIGHRTTSTNYLTDLWVWTLPNNPSPTDQPRLESIPEIYNVGIFGATSYTMFILAGTMTSNVLATYDWSSMTYKAATGLDIPPAPFGSSPFLGGGVINDAFCFQNNNQAGYNASNGFVLVSSRGDFTSPPNFEAQILVGSATVITDFKTYLFKPNAILLNVSSSPGTFSASFMIMAIVCLLQYIAQ